MFKQFVQDRAPKNVLVATSQMRSLSPIVFIMAAIFSCSIVANAGQTANLSCVVERRNTNVNRVISRSEYHFVQSTSKYDFGPWDYSESKINVGKLILTLKIGSNPVSGETEDISLSNFDDRSSNFTSVNGPISGLSVSGFCDDADHVCTPIELDRAHSITNIFCKIDKIESNQN